MFIGELIYRIGQLPAELQRRSRHHSSRSIAQICADVLLPARLRTNWALVSVACAFFACAGSTSIIGRLLSVDSGLLIVVYVASRAARLVGVCSNPLHNIHNQQQPDADDGIDLRVARQTASGLDNYNFIRSASGLDYGSGMALSYFHGYLKLVLPALGDYHSKSIVERMEDYEARRHVAFPVKKLFILVPDSMYTPSTLNAPTLDVQTPLEKLLLNRAGSFRREYHNSVYKIQGTGGWYVVTEGATPLKTFQEALATAAAAHLQRYRKEIVSSFVRHLKELLLNDPDCRDLCEVVQFEDRGADGALVDYGQVLRRAIEELLDR